MLSSVLAVLAAAGNAVGGIVVGLGLGMFAAAPRGGTLQAPAWLWTAVTACCLGAMVVLCAVAVRLPVGHSRAARMGLAAATNDSAAAGGWPSNSSASWWPRPV